LIPFGIFKHGTKVMQLTVKLFAYFRDNRFKQKIADYPEGTTVEDIIRSLGIDLDEVGVTMINSRHCDLHRCRPKGINWPSFRISAGDEPSADSGHAALFCMVSQDDCSGVPERVKE
jgi:sulfur-carrier protein